MGNEDNGCAVVCLTITNHIMMGLDLCLMVRQYEHEPAASIHLLRLGGAIGVTFKVEKAEVNNGDSAY